MPSPSQIHVIMMAIICCIQRASTYTDLRAAPCMHPDILAIPLERAEWLGTIRMVMSCDEGYDLPLNAPRGGRFKCVPDGSPWQPPFIPDCNPFQRPLAILGVLSLLVDPSSCADDQPASTEDVNQKRNALKEFEFNEICNQNGLGPCSLNETAFYCATPSTAKSEDLVSLMNFTAPFFMVVINLTYNRTMTNSMYDEGLRGVHLALKEGFPTIPGGKSAKSAQCPTGTRPLVRLQDKTIVCRGCSLGHYLKAGRCEPCEPGYYGDYTMQTQCKLCPTLVNVTDTRVWDQIRETVPNASYAILFCPTLRHDPTTGVLTVKPSRTIIGQEPQPSEPEHELPLPQNANSPNNSGGFPSICGVLMLVSGWATLLLCHGPKNII